MKQLVPIFTLALLCLFASNALAQNKHEARLFYSFSYTEFTEASGYDSRQSYNLNNNSEFGALYLRKISKRFALRTGIGYSTQKLQIDGPILYCDFVGGETCGTQILPTPSRPFQTITFPIGVEISFGKYLYAHGGILYSDQIAGGADYRTAGLGYDIGVGFKYGIGPFNLYVNPNFKLRNAHTFTKGDKIEADTWKSSGLDFMVGYSF
ncbi:hypothetical protein FUAX_13110 [Fulvitalea axinellae]|uniref:Outer membrane protein beta-barrel domain-containing protein n=1 Tax=Fulvitalea axinellae TaxID=1182444 RepID=A0AAU9CA02_9BACT|nr:hypothetical protein FUAX_13110 [Fulvitalea axinellae]